MKRRWIILSVLVILVLGLSLLLRPKPGSFAASAAFASSIMFPYAQTEDSFYYFNGSRFVSYELNGNKTTPLTRILRLPTVIDVKWGKQAVLFKAVGYTPVDELYPVLNQRNLITSESYWWYFDFAIGSLQLVGVEKPVETVSDVVWLPDGESFIYQKVHDELGLNEERIVINVFFEQRKEHADKLVEVSSPLDELLWTDGSRLIGRKDNIIKTINLADGVESKITESLAPGGSATVSYDGKLVAFTSTPEGAEKPAERERNIDAPPEDGNTHATQSGPLHLIDVGTQSEKIISESFQGRIIFSDDAKSLIGIDTVSSTTKGVISDTTTGETFVLSIKVSDDVIPNYLTFLHQEPLVIILTDTKNQAYLAGKDKRLLGQLPKIKTSDIFKDKKNIYQDGFYIAYFPNQNQYAVYVTSGDFNTRAEAATDYLQSQGIDPNQLNIKWYRPEDQ